MLLKCCSYMVSERLINRHIKWLNTASLTIRSIDEYSFMSLQHYLNVSYLLRSENFSVQHVTAVDTSVCEFNKLIAQLTAT